MKVTAVALVGAVGEKAKSPDNTTGVMVMLADCAWMFGVGVAESVPVTLMLNVPLVLYIVEKLEPVPEDGVPPVDVQAKVIGGVPPVAAAVQLTTMPTVPEVGQLIVTTSVAADPIVWVALAVLPLASVTVSTTVNGPVVKYV